MNGRFRAFLIQANFYLRTVQNIKNNNNKTKSICGDHEGCSRFFNEYHMLDQHTVRKICHILIIKNLLLLLL